MPAGEFAGRQELDSNCARLATANLFESDRLDFVPSYWSVDGHIFESTFADNQPDGRSEPLGRCPDLRDAVQKQCHAGHNEDDAGGSLAGPEVVATDEEAQNSAGGHDHGHEQVALGTAPIVVDRHGRTQRGVVHLDGVGALPRGHRPTMMTRSPPPCRRPHVRRATSVCARARIAAQAFEYSIARPFGISPQKVRPPAPEETTVTAAKPTTSVDDPGPSVAALETIVSLSKRRGFIFPSSEIYGGINAVWDYGQLGVELKNNVKRAWWRAMVQERNDIVGLDASIIMAPQVWVTSGHVANFTDPLVECQTCRRRFRLDELPGAEDLTNTELLDPTVVDRLGLKCPADGGPLSPPRRFNLMFKTFMGPVEEEAAQVYLRPETAQGIYVNFRNVRESSRKKLPFGIAQIGKAFRNEISPGNFVFRMREFEQMEMQYFVKPETAAAVFEEWMPRRKAWYERYGVNPARLRFREHRPDELAHYAKKAVDIEYRFPFGWKELEGIHNRGDWDLGRHQEATGENLEYFDPATEEKYVPWVVETSAGGDRAAFTFLIDAYREEEVRGEKRVVLGFNADLAPYKVAVLPLLKKREEIVGICHKLREDLARDIMAVYDDTAAIGKLYRRQDEIGTPWCVTIDVDSLEDGQATIRDRDSMEQIRVDISQVKPIILERLAQARA